jgi:hypothetical protein
MVCILHTEDIFAATAAEHEKIELRWENGGFALDRCTSFPLPLTTANPVRDMDTSSPRKQELDKEASILLTRRLTRVDREEAATRAMLKELKELKSFPTVKLVQALLGCAVLIQLKKKKKRKIIGRVSLHVFAPLWRAGRTSITPRRKSYAKKKRRMR